MTSLTVDTNPFQARVLMLAGAFMIPLGLAALIQGLTPSFNPVGVGIGTMMLAIYGFLWWNLLKARGRSVQSFSDAGVRRHDGRLLPWADLARVVYRIRTKTFEVKLWRTELHFANGESAWLLPLGVRNVGEVDAFVRALPCPHDEQH